jgi:hypothetical protein
VHAARDGRLAQHERVGRAADVLAPRDLEERSEI